MTKHIPIFVAAAISLSSCTHLSRQPASLQQAQVAALEENYFRALDNEVKDINKRDLNQPIIMNGDTIFTETAPRGIIHSFQRGHRKADEFFQIRFPDYYEMDSERPSHVYFFDDTNDMKYALRIENYSIRNRHKQTKTYDEKDYFLARISCDGDYQLRAGPRLLKRTTSEIVEFPIFGLMPTRAPVSILYPGANTNECVLTWKDPRKPGKKYGTRLLRERAFIRNEFQQIRSSFQSCLLPRPANQLSNIQKFFLTPNYRQMTCPMAIDKIVSHPEAYDGLNAKIEMLLGQRLTDEQIRAKNPDMPLDFSKAPKLDVIVVSYLVYTADFGGKLLTRILKWHADQGAQVRIFVSKVAQLSKEDKMLNDLVASNGNVKLREYYFDAKSDKGSLISQLHRVNHVKMLVTLSFDHPEHDKALVGGRNIHDGFIFKELGQQGKAYWRDFEATIYSSAFARELVGHFYTLWDQDINNSYVRSWTQNVMTSGKTGPDYFEQSEKTPLVRHYISTPYAEERLVEDLFADMIDHAEKKVLISTPYFRLSRKLANAFERAIARGVEMRLITRLKLNGDTADFILGDVNKAGVNKFYNKIKVFEYSEESTILHSKLILIDDQFSLVTSVNLNRRSFVHDTENATLVYSRDYNQELTKLVEEYMTLSHQITEKQSIMLWKRILLELFNDKF